MTTQETARPSEPPTFAEIRETFAEAGRMYREIAAQMAENEARAKKNDARAKKREAKAEREMEALRKRQEATDRQIAETGRQIKKTESYFTSQWGKLMESLVDGDLVPLLNGRGIAVEHTHQRREGRRNGEHFEFDIVAVNRRDVVVVEVKTTLRSEDVTRFLAKLSKFTDFAREYRGKRILGAVAYLQSDSDVTKYAERKGLFVIRATGSSASIVNAEDFEPRSFG